MTAIVTGFPANTRRKAVTMSRGLLKLPLVDRKPLTREAFGGEAFFGKSVEKARPSALGETRDNETHSFLSALQKTASSF
jgi:hypothetical protein